MKSGYFHSGSNKIEDPFSSAPSAIFQTRGPHLEGQYVECFRRNLCNLSALHSKELPFTLSASLFSSYADFLSTAVCFLCKFSVSEGCKSPREQEVLETRDYKTGQTLWTSRTGKEALLQWKNFALSISGRGGYEG